jgi:RNA polymerase sigma-70 factor (ECF subfamily)
MTTDRFRSREGDSDGDLVREVVAGSHEALAALYDRHVDGIYAAARRLTRDRQVAEEVVQETFLVLWNRAELYNDRSGSLAAWLHTIARHRTIDRLRAAGRRPTLAPLTAVAHPDETTDAAFDRLGVDGTPIAGSAPPPEPEAAAVSAWTRHRIQDALAEMPDDERRVIVMAYDDDLSQSEIADRLGWPIGTVKTRTRRALHRLRGVLADLGDERRVQDATTVRIGGHDGPR